MDDVNTIVLGVIAGLLVRWLTTPGSPKEADDKDDISEEDAPPSLEAVYDLHRAEKLVKKGDGGGSLEAKPDTVDEAYLPTLLQ